MMPDITQRILDGMQPADLMADRLIKNTSLPMVWAEQRQLIG